jgi:hypothetical protein
MPFYSDGLIRDILQNNTHSTWTSTPVKNPCKSLEQRIAVLESQYNILEKSLTSLEKANQRNLQERDLAYQKLGEYLMRSFPLDD